VANCLLDDRREHFVDAKFELRVCSFARKKGVRFIAFKAWFQMILSEGVTSFGITGYCPSASGGKM
jgi:hypothetical protein